MAGPFFLGTKIADYGLGAKKYMDNPGTKMVKHWFHALPSSRFATTP